MCVNLKLIFSFAGVKEYAQAFLTTSLTGEVLASRLVISVGDRVTFQCEGVRLFGQTN